MPSEPMASAQKRGIARRTSSKHSSILFVCGGNTCRSPMAVGLARTLFGPQVAVASAGVDAMLGGRAAANAVRAMREVGIDISSHRPRDISVVPIHEYDYIVAMDPAVAKHLEEAGLVDGRSLIVWNVEDPFRGDLARYRTTARAIGTLLTSLGRSLGLTSGDDSPGAAKASR